METEVNQKRSGKGIGRNFSRDKQEKAIFKPYKQKRKCMDLKCLNAIWERIERRENCGSCPLRTGKTSPLIFRPDRDVKVTVITQGPNRIEKPEVIASLANHPTFTYLSALLGGKFRPAKEATVYWTHLRKCFIRDEHGQSVVEGRDADKVGKKAVKLCSRAYLMDEIKAARPKFILAVGGDAREFLYRNSKDERLSGGVEETLLEYGIVKSVKLENSVVDVAVVPHPSGRSRLWLRPSERAAGALESIREAFLEIIES